jgi:hypothetical protein
MSVQVSLKECFLKEYQALNIDSGQDISFSSDFILIKIWLMER